MLVPTFIWYLKTRNLDGIFLMEGGLKRGFNVSDELTRIKNSYHQ